MVFAGIHGRLRMRHRKRWCFYSDGGVKRRQKEKARPPSAVEKRRADVKDAHIQKKGIFADVDLLKNTRALDVGRLVRLHVVIDSQPHFTQLLMNDEWAYEKFPHGGF